MRTSPWMRLWAVRPWPDAAVGALGGPGRRPWPDAAVGALAVGALAVGAADPGDRG